jgi:hypothetical protein
MGGGVRLSTVLRMERRRNPSSSMESPMVRIAAIVTVLLVAHAMTPTAVNEEHADGCRVHLVVENASPRAYSSYRLDLVIFARDGVIARRLALETAPLRANKTMVKEFALNGLACAGVGRILLNDVSACVSAEVHMDDCVASTRISSRAAVAFVK